jgi:hypothetical protein
MAPNPMWETAANEGGRFPHAWDREDSEGSRSGLLAKWFFGGLGYQGQKTTLFQENTGLLALPPRAGPIDTGQNGGTDPSGPTAAGRRVRVGRQPLKLREVYSIFRNNASGP